MLTAWSALMYWMYAPCDVDSAFTSCAHQLQIPFRRSIPLELSTAVKQYISNKYDQHPDMFATDLAMVDKLRTDAINVQEAHVSGIPKLSRYAVQLQWMSGKFPIDVCILRWLFSVYELRSTKVGAEFSWYTALGYNTTKLCMLAMSSHLALWLTKGYSNPEQPAV